MKKDDLIAESICIVTSSRFIRCVGLIVTKRERSYCSGDLFTPESSEKQMLGAGAHKNTDILQTVQLFIFIVYYVRLFSNFTPLQMCKNRKKPHYM